MKRKLIKRNKNKLCDLRQTARQQDHPVNLYLSSRVTHLRQLYSIIKSIRAMPEGRLEHQSALIKPFRIKISLLQFIRIYNHGVLICLALQR